MMINDLKQRAYEQERSENFGRAIELYESVIDHRETEGLTHQDASVFLRIADLHLRRNRDEDAIEAFQRAGELYAREGLQPQAIAVYRRILRFAPEHTEALWNLAWLHAEMGVMAEARDYVSDYLETVDLERDWVEAKDFLRRLLDLSEDVGIGLRLAELLEEGDRHEEALDVLERLDVDFGPASTLDEEETRARIESLREEVEPEHDTGANGDYSGDSELEGATAGFGDAPSEEFDDGSSDLGADDVSGSGGLSGPGVADEDGTDDFDIEVDAEEGRGSLDEGFPFPDDEDELENGAFDEQAFGSPDADEPEELAADGFEAGGDFGTTRDDVGPSKGEFTEDDFAPAEGDAFPSERDEREESEQEKEEQMSARSQDFPGGPAVEEDEDSETATTPGAGPGGFGGAPAGGETDEVSPDAGASGRGQKEEEYGERAELRRGLEVLDELIELDPDRLEHYRRRVGYAERLDDPDALTDSWLELADALLRRDSSRGARLVYEHALSLDPGAEAAREGIEELNERARESLDVPEPFPDADVDPAGQRGGDSELAELVWPELDRALGQVQWLQGAARLMDDGGLAASDGPPADAYELVGRYLLAKGEVDEAIDALSLALDREDLDDEELADVLFQLGLSHYRIDDRGSARRYFDRVASHDEDFRTVSDWVLSEE